MNTDDSKTSLDQKKDDSIISQAKKKKITRGKLLQSANKKYNSNTNVFNSTSRQTSNKRVRHLGGISRGYLDSGTISNTMRLYNKHSNLDGNGNMVYGLKKSRSKKIGNYQRKALNKLTGSGNKKKLRDLAMMFSDDDGDVEDEENNDNFEDFFRDSRRDQEGDVDMMNGEDNEASSTEQDELSGRKSGQHVLEASSGSMPGGDEILGQPQSVLPTLAGLQNSNTADFDKKKPLESSRVDAEDNAIMAPARDAIISTSEAISGQLVIPASMKRNMSNHRGVMSNDGEEDYDDDEFGYDGDEDFEGDDSNGNSKKDLQRRKQLESDFDDQFIMSPGFHSVDNLITESSQGYSGLGNVSRKASESPDLNFGLSVGKRRRRSSNFQDVANKSGIMSSLLSKVPIQPEPKKAKLKSNSPELSVAKIVYENSPEGSLDDLSSAATAKKLKRKHLKPPKIVLDSTYSKSLTIKDIRDLVIYSLDKNEKNRPVWCKVENRMNIEKVIVLQIPGVQPKDLKYKGTSLRSFDELLNDKNKILKTTETFFNNDNTLTLFSKAPGNSSFVFSPYSAFTNVPLTKQKQATVIKNLSKKKRSLPDMLLSLDEMIELQYPIHPDIARDNLTLSQKIIDLNVQQVDSSAWVQTCTKNTDNGYVPRAYALDCEMCLTKIGHELTRISVVSFDDVFVYDKLVRPRNDIVDYLTRFSGITEEMMTNVDYTLEQVQNDLLALFDSRDIIIGHSLQSDFKVMKFRHPNIIDTAVIYEHIKGPPFKPALKKLSSVFLGKEIQNDELAGHDPSIDAKTCIDLVKLKLAKGLQTGLNLNSETIFKKLQDSSNVRSLIFNKFGPDEALTKLNEEAKLRCVSFKDDNDIIDKILKNLDDCSLFVGKLSVLESARYFGSKSAVSSGHGSGDGSFEQNTDKTSFESDTVDSIKEEQAIKSLNNILKTLTDNISKNSMLVLFSGAGDLRLYKKLTAEINSIHIPEKRRLESLRRKDELKQAVERARDSIVTVYIKK